MRQRNKRNRIRVRWENSTIRFKMISVFAGTSMIVFLLCLFLYSGMNRTMTMIEAVYSTNVSLNTLSEELDHVQTDLYQYLKTRSSDALETYYQDTQIYGNQIQELNQKNTDNQLGMLEKNIYEMSESYLDLVETTIQSKRGRNVEAYKTSYEEATQLYQYITDYIDTLNNLQFQENAQNYEKMNRAVGYLEWMISAIFLVMTLTSICAMLAIIGHMTRPLTQLARTANQVANGDFEVELLETTSGDEIGVVTKAFNKMVASVRLYIQQIQSNAKKEQEMKERELLMETHLKDAQLKYLQAQINPHFLFNSLNAGAQLAMLEDAERTCTFVEKMADFFRYNVKKMEEDASLREEIEAVDNYVYIMNVRFGNEINYSKVIDERVRQDEIHVPSMILQPLVENAMTHGIRGVEWDTYIKLEITSGPKSLYISVEDNGIGMTQEQINRILGGVREREQSDIEEQENRRQDSTGVAIGNVIERLKLYYRREQLLEIRSEGKGRGTRFIITIPLEGGEENV